MDAARTVANACRQWEPTYDVDRWRREGRLSLFVQKVGQGDGESLEDVPAQPVSVLDWEP